MMTGCLNFTKLVDTTTSDSESFPFIPSLSLVGLSEEVVCNENVMGV